MIYKIQLSTKESINISKEEYDKFKTNLDKNFIEFKEGIINPSFVVSVTIDHEATRDENKKRQMLENTKLIESPRESNPVEIKQMLEKYKPEFIKEIESSKNQ